MPNVLDNLGNRIQEEYLRNKWTVGAGVHDHRKRVDDRNSIEQRLDQNIPDRSNVAILNVDSTKQKGNTERESVKFEDRKRHEEPRPGRSNTVKQRKDNNNTEVDSEVDQSSSSRRNHDDIFRETNFAKEITALDNGLDTLASTLSKEVPENGAG